MADKTLHSPEQRVLVEMLRQARQEAGLLQVELAERLGRPQSFVSKYESGERRLDLIELRAICLVLQRNLVSFVHEFEQRVDRI